MKKISIFVDVQNVYYTSRSAYKKNFDYNKFWAKISAQGTIINAYAYAVDRNDTKQKQFQTILRAIGFEVKLKPFIQRADGSAKGDWDVGITIDMMESAAESDLMVLVSGDGDFDILLNKIHSKYQIPVEVYGVPALSAASLMNAATHFHPIDDALLL